MSLRGTRKLTKDGRLKIEMFEQKERPWHKDGKPEPEKCLACGRESRSGRMRYREDGKDKAWFCGDTNCQRVGLYWQTTGYLPPEFGGPEIKSHTVGGPTIIIPDPTVRDPWEVVPDGE